MSIFGQLLVAPFPTGYVNVYEEARGERYIRESVLEGESFDRWSRMITITGAKGVSLRPEVTPKSFATNIAAHFQSACPASFSAQGLGDGRIDGADMFVAVASCGISPTRDGNRSETTLIVVIKGSSDYYTIQWAERGAPSDTPLAIDAAHWRGKYQELTPIKLCARSAGEAACLNRH